MGDRDARAGASGLHVHLGGDPVAQLADVADHPDGPAACTLQALRNAGTSVMIDDFGTGYSTLSYLHTIPCDVLKLDGSFVRSISEDTRLRAIVRRSIQLAHDLGMTVVAECIET